jgi:serine/threonine protein kinase
MRKKIGEGTYGCVYYPPLKCKQQCNEDKCNVGVSKLMKSNAAYDELNMFNLVSRLDQSYVVTKPILCEVSDEEDISDCAIEWETGDAAALLIYDHLGVDMIAYLKSFDIDDLAKFLLNFTIIFYALIDMEKKGIIHQDIKPENIMVTEDLSMKLIDYGLMMDVKAPLTIPAATQYMFWPNDRQFLEADIDDEAKMEIRKKLDTYSLGITLGEILSHFVGGSTIDTYLYNDLAKLSSEMTSQNSFERLSPYEAFAEYACIMNRYFPKNDVIKKYRMKIRKLLS